MEKSYVSLEQHICPVCLKTFDTGNLLFDEQLRNIFERYTVTGYELCEEHKKVIEDGYGKNLSTGKIRTELEILPI